MRFLPAAVIVILCATSPCAGAAPKLLQWKLQPGQEFQVQVAQNSKTETTVKNRTVKMSLDMLMDMTWTVDEVDPAGLATISQMFSRIRVDMDAPSVGKVLFDTSKETKPGELTEGMAEALGPLINAKFSVQMNPRGEIVKVDIPRETVAAIKQATTTSKLRQLLSVDGLTQLLQQSLARLPEEAIEPGHQWSLETTIASPLGQLNQTHQYTYHGTVQRKGNAVERIDVSTELFLEPSETTTAKKMKVRSHKQSGSLFFDAESGRFVATEIQQTLVSETPYQNLPIVVSVETTSRTEISPVR